jgi:hypothetical protein
LEFFEVSAIKNLNIEEAMGTLAHKIVESNRPVTPFGKQ